MTATAPTLSAYWQSVAAHNALTLDESDALAAYLDAHPTAGDDGETSASIIAASMKPGVIAALSAYEAIDHALAAQLGESVSHAMLGDGAATLSVYASTASSMLTCVSTGERTGYRINRQTYTTPADIPTSQRKHRAIAHTFQTAHDAGTIRASIAAWLNWGRAYRRMNTFDRA